MFHKLIASYVDGVPSDQQPATEFFFTDRTFWLDYFGIDIDKSTGSDKETLVMINLMLTNFELPDNIAQMLTDWKTDGVRLNS